MDYLSDLRFGVTSTWLSSPGWQFDTYRELYQGGLFPAELELADGGALVMEAVGNLELMLIRNRQTTVRLGKVMGLLTARKNPTWLPGVTYNFPMLNQKLLDSVMNWGNFGKLPKELQDIIYKAERLYTNDYFFREFLFAEHMLRNQSEFIAMPETRRMMAYDEFCRVMQPLP